MGHFLWGHVIRNPECNLGAAAASAASAPCSSGALPDGRARKGRSLRCDARGAAHRGRGGARRARAGDHVSAAQGARWAKPPMVGACAVALLLPTAARCVRRMARCAGATRRADDRCCTRAGRAGLSMRASAPVPSFAPRPLGVERPRTPPARQTDAFISLPSRGRRLRPPTLAMAALSALLCHALVLPTDLAPLCARVPWRPGALSSLSSWYVATQHTQSGRLEGAGEKGTHCLGWLLPEPGCAHQPQGGGLLREARCVARRACCDTQFAL